MSTQIHHTRVFLEFKTKGTDNVQYDKYFLFFLFLRGQYDKYLIEVLKGLHQNIINNINFLVKKYNQ